MKAELGISPEIEAELGFIEKRISDSVDKLGLSSTQGYCHQINWAIACKLYQTFGWEISDYHPSHLRIRNPGNPFISYVNDGKINAGGESIHHSFPLLVGLTDKIILLDGAHDQADSGTPFLIAGIGSSFFRELKQWNLGVADKPENFYYAARELTLRYPRILDAMVSYQYISQDQREEAIRQFDFEKSAGLFYLTAFNRDTVSYFMASLGINYPSTQPVQDALKKYMKDMKIDPSQSFA